MRSPLLVSPFLFLLILSASNLQAQNRDIKGKVKPFLKAHCIKCHGPDREEGGVRLDELKWDIGDLDSIDEVQNILDEIVVGSMPPESEPRPNAKALNEVTGVLREHITKARKKFSSGGGKPIRRLTKTEYVNTLQDLLGVRIDSGDLPGDSETGRFDTHAIDLYTTDMHLDICLETARGAVERFIASRNTKPVRTELKADKAPQVKKGIFLVDARDVPPAGYLVKQLVCWKKNPADSKPVFLGPKGTPIYQITGTPKSPQIIERTFYKSGSEVWAANADVVVGRVESIRVINSQPFEFFGRFQKRYGEQVPDKVATKIIEEFVTLANRGRKVDKKLVKRLVDIFRMGRKQGEPFWQAIVEPMAVSMCTMEAMFHFETRGQESDSRYVSTVEMVNRVSYFLWRSAPDAELLGLAKSKKWYEPKVRIAQFERMMKDEKFDRFLRDFTTQWLELDRQDAIAVDDRLFDEFNEGTKAAIKEETVQFVSEIIRENLSLTNLVDSDFMMVNNLTAKHYGLKKVSGSEFRRVPVPEGSSRGGILTQAGILMQGGTGERTSIVERGAFILRKLLNDPPGPPPPLVGELPTEGESFASMTAAELVRAHRSNSQCASCHKKIDSLGIALEEFDAVGLERTQDVRINPEANKRKRKRGRNNNQTLQVRLETKGQLGSRKLNGVEGLKKVLLSKDDQLAEGFINALLTLSNGRKAGVADRTIVRDIVKRSKKVDFPARSILIALMQSDAFKTH